MRPMTNDEFWLLFVGVANVVVGALLHSTFEMAIGVALLVCSYTFPEA